MTLPQPQHTLEEIMNIITSADDSIRNKAFEEIISCGNEAIAPLITLLAHSDEQVRDSAVWALCEMRDIAGNALIQELSNKNPLVREKAAFCLGICKNPQATKALIARLKDEYENVRETAAWSLVKIGYEDAHTIEEVVACLDDDSILVKESAQWILEHIGEQAFDPLLQKLMQSSLNSDLIINIISKIASARIDDLLQNLKATRDTQQLSYIITILGQSREPKVIEYIIPFVNHNNRQIITTAVNALIAIGELSIEPLFQKITDETVFPINEMMPLFVKFKRVAVPKLIELMHSSNNSLRIFAVRALGVIEDKRAIEHCIQGLSDPNHHFVEACARALGAFSNKMIIKPLTDLIMNEKYPIIKSNAILALTNAIDEKAALTLLQSFNDAPLIVKKRLIQLASYFPNEQTENLLQSALSIDDEECTMLAIQGLKKIGTEKSQECVRNVIIHANPYISDEARAALKEITERKQRGNLKTLENYDDFV